MGITMMKDSEILKVARDLIASDKEIHVCRAIDKIDDKDMSLYPQCESLRVWIRSMMGECIVLEEWINQYHPSLYDEDIDWDLYTAKRKSTRLAWLDWMITYCENEENLEDNLKSSL
jgi:hypothetical protein